MAQSTKPKSPASTSLLATDLTQLHRAIRWALDTRLFNNLTPHGNTTWTPPELILLAFFWVWSECTTLTGAFAHAHKLTTTLLGKVALKSYTGFIDALTNWTPRLISRVRNAFHRRMERIAGTHWRVGRWLALAVDGSRTTTPRTKKNETAFNPKHYGRGRRARSRTRWKNKRRRVKKLGQPVKPQIWLTLIWHIGLRMPWAWTCGPSNASERQHLIEMLDQKYPENTLFCGDAGFVGYELWQAIAARGHHFLMRVGNNVRLLRRLGRVRQRGDEVHLWPGHAMGKNQPPVALRLLTFGGGRRRVYAVTNVLAESELSTREASELYQRRWGVEVQFRSLKQTFGRSELRSRTPERAVAELEWSIVGLWLVQLLSASEQLRSGIGPERSSVSVAVCVVREAMRGWGQSGRLRARLADAVKDTYQRRGSKAARYRPPTKDKPAAGAPILIDANAEQKRKYQQWLEEQ